MKNWKIGLLCLLMTAALLLCACAAPMSVNAFPAENKPVKVGDSITIKLDGNATTGYTWEYELQPRDAFELVKFESVAKSGAPGASSSNVWVFKALKSSAGALIFRYHRPWEADTEPLTVLRYEVSVE